MDYGNYLKKNGTANLAQSRHYKKQSPLKGSIREMRGRIIKSLVQTSLNKTQLKTKVSADERFEAALQALLKERLIKNHSGNYRLA